MNSIDTLFSDIELSQKDPCELICEACEDYKGTALEYARALMNAQMLSDSVMRNYRLNLKQTKLYCMESGGSDDDYENFEEAASQGAIGKLRAIIDKIIQFWVDLCHKTAQIIRTKICTAQAKTAVKKMKKEVQLNATLAGKKVQAPDISSALSVIERYRKRCDMDDAKMVRGIITRSPEKGIGATISDFEKAFKNATVGAAGVCVITVAGLIVAIEQEMDRLPTVVKNLEETQSHILNRLASSVSDETAAAAMEAMQVAANFRVQLGKQELDTHMQYLANLIKLAKELVTNAKGKGEVVMNVVEDAEDTVAISDDLFEEGVNKDSKNYFKEAKNEFKIAMKEAKQCVKVRRYKEANEALDGADAVLAKTIKQIDAIPQDSKDAAYGNAFETIKIMANSILMIVPVIGLLSVSQMCKEVMADTIGRENSKLAKGSLNTADMNSYTTQLKGKLTMMRDAIKKMKTRVKDMQSKSATQTEDAMDLLNFDGLFNEDADSETFEESVNANITDEELDHFLDGVLDTIL